MQEQIQANYIEKSENVQVEVWPYYVEERSRPQDGYFFYAYKVKISNIGESRIRLLRRHWIIRNGKGKQEHIQGEGVVGQRPVLMPGEFFEYTSFCPLETPTGNMRGKFQFSSEPNLSFWVKIPLFFFHGPRLH